MAKPLLCAFVVALFTLSSHSQTFKPGKLIRSDGDTLNGFIYNNAVNRNPSQIIFRRTENEAGTKYVPASINGFIVNDQSFRSAIVSKNAELLSPMSARPEFTLTKDTVFLMLLIDGSKSLSVFRD